MTKHSSFELDAWNAITDTFRLLNRQLAKDLGARSVLVRRKR